MKIPNLAKLLFHKEKEAVIPQRSGWEKAFIEYKDKSKNEIIIPDFFEDETLD